ncbi:hypothetical protein [Hoeflea sp.]|uniref:hypothetical protein n=1 Tax=Hoeflea sp. TaxID=1940281 RepID=UPI003B52D69E
MQHLATASFKDTYAGFIPVKLVPFRTKRKGVTVTRYAWKTMENGGIGIWRDPSFPTVEHATRAASRIPHLFKDITATA